MTYASEILPEKDAVFVVDDQRTSRIIIESIAKTIADNIEVISFENATDALLAAEKKEPALILTDYKMPNMDGVEFIRKLRNKSGNEDVPIVIITALDDKEALYKALEAGATDFLVKPVDPRECRVRCRNLITMHRQKLIIKSHAKTLEKIVKNVEKKLHIRELETLAKLAKAGEFKGKISGRNLVRMGKFTNIIAEKLGIDEEHREILQISSMMHDIGKIGIPDNILLKEGPLDESEFKVMKNHSTIGYEILKDSDSPYLQMGALIALHHHEKFDGSGYPKGLRGNEIPIEARISSVADVFDALISVRSYKKAWSFDKAFEYIKNQKGSHLDPECVDAFVSLKEKLKKIITDSI